MGEAFICSRCDGVYEGSGATYDQTSTACQAWDDDAPSGRLELCDACEDEHEEFINGER